MFVQDVLKARPAEIVVVAPDSTIRDAARRLFPRRPGVVVVADSTERVLGLVSEWDIVRCVAQSDVLGPSPQAIAIAARDLPACHPMDRLDVARARMAAHRRRHLPVVADGRLVGIISLTEILSWLFEEAEYDNASLQAYFLGLGYA